MEMLFGDALLYLPAAAACRSTACDFDKSYYFVCERERPKYIYISHLSRVKRSNALTVDNAFSANSRSNTNRCEEQTNCKHRTENPQRDSRRWLSIDFAVLNYSRVCMTYAWHECFRFSCSNPLQTNNGTKTEKWWCATCTHSTHTPHRNASVVFYVFLFLRLFSFHHVERILFGYFRVILSLLAFVHCECWESWEFGTKRWASQLASKCVRVDMPSAKIFFVNSVAQTHTGRSK